MSETPGGPSQHWRQHAPVTDPDVDDSDPGQQFPVENQPAPPVDKAEEQAKGKKKGKKK